MFELTRMRIFTIISILTGLAGAFEARSWTDTQGRKIDATFVRADDRTVILKLKDGREVPFPLTKLSAEDGSYIDASREKLKSETPARPTESKGDRESPDFDSPWPETLRFTEDPEINVIEEDVGKKRFVYESANYRYVCDVRLSKSVVKGFAMMFEATHLFCRSLPLGLNGGRKTDGKLQIVLFENFDDYVAAGGPPSTAGVFMGGKGVVLVPLTSLGVRPLGSGYMLDRTKSSKTLPHELTHQLTPEPYFGIGAMGWFTEGLAEYVANTPYRSGTYTVRGNLKAIIEYTTAYGAKDTGGRALGTKISMAPLKTFMLQDYASFTAQAQLNYGCGLLITTYFLHLDGQGDAKRMKNYLKALMAGNDAEKSLDLLLDGRTFEELEKDVIKAWGNKGVAFTFGK
ncbi:MAG: SHD1 domain-containing protein [Luteolibacter sp.]